MAALQSGRRFPEIIVVVVVIVVVDVLIVLDVVVADGFVVVVLAGTQRPLTSDHPGGQLVHSLVADPLHVAQLTLHAPA
jgi:hypothetical protein